MENKYSTEYDTGQEFSGAARGRSTRGADGTRLWRPPGAELRPSCRRTVAPGKRTGPLTSRNSAITAENSRLTASLCAKTGKRPRAARALGRTQLSAAANSWRRPQGRERSVQRPLMHGKRRGVAVHSAGAPLTFGCGAGRWPKALVRSTMSASVAT